MLRDVAKKKRGGPRHFPFFFLATSLSLQLKQTDMASNLVANHLLVNVDGLWQKGIELERGEADAIEGGVAVDRVHNVQPRLEMK